MNRVKPASGHGFGDDDTELLPMALLLTTSESSTSTATMPALPVDSSALAASLREHEALLLQAGARIAELTATLEPSAPWP